MRINGFGSLIDYDYLRFILKEPVNPFKKQKTDTFVSTIKKQTLKSFNNENKKAFLRSITSRR